MTDIDYTFPEWPLLLLNGLVYSSKGRDTTERQTRQRSFKLPASSSISEHDVIKARGFPQSYVIS